MAAAAGCIEELALSSLEFSCFSFSKYRVEANSVRWRGSMMSCVWPLGHPVAVFGRCVIDEPYQDREGRRSLQRRLARVARDAKGGFRMAS